MEKLGQYEACCWYAKNPAEWMPDSAEPDWTLHSVASDLPPRL